MLYIYTAMKFSGQGFFKTWSLEFATHMRRCFCGQPWDVRGPVGFMLFCSDDVLFVDSHDFDVNPIQQTNSLPSSRTSTDARSRGEMENDLRVRLCYTIIMFLLLSYSCDISLTCVF